jgi:hypothetical protein
MMADSHWSRTAHDAKFTPFLDAKAFSPFPALLIFKSLILLAVGLIFLVFFFILERKGLSFSIFLKKMRNWFVGPTRSVRKIK